MMNENKILGVHRIEFRQTDNNGELGISTEMVVRYDLRYVTVLASAVGEICRQNNWHLLMTVKTLCEQCTLTQSDLRKRYSLANQKKHGYPL